uniref:BLTX316 n=1 Tax=Nephila pilipes TaxID=299642 RepID=A0A076L2K1_NEPPI|nr:BLTX316 [Nephila pilipes]AII97798.1 BLTX425 [Nephila pilipes]AII97849.1 BLTX480 [Nephila pilipes]
MPMTVVVLIFSNDIAVSIRIVYHLIGHVKSWLTTQLTMKLKRSYICIICTEIKLQLEEQVCLPLLICLNCNGILS